MLIVSKCCLLHVLYHVEYLVMLEWTKCSLSVLVQSFPLLPCSENRIVHLNCTCICIVMLLSFGLSDNGRTCFVLHGNSQAMHSFCLACKKKQELENLVCALCLCPEGMQLLKTGTSAVLLPGTFLFLRSSLFSLSMLSRLESFGVTFYLYIKGSQKTRLIC